MEADKEGGSDEQGQAGLADDIEKAWDEIETTTEQEPIEDDSGRLRDPVTKRFVAKTKSDEEGEDGGEEEPTEQIPAVAPPEHWSQADKDAFNALPEELKPLYLEKVKSLESGWNKKFEEVANERKSFEGYKAFKEIFDPYQQQLAMAGLTPEAYVRKLLAIGQALEANPEQVIRQLAAQYRVDLGKPADGAEMDENADPEIAALKSAILEQQQMLQALVQQQHQSVARTFEQEWAGFQNAKDASGNPMFPEAEKLRIRMGQELQVNPQAPGETMRQALERAYEAVKWTDPDIRKSLLEAEARKAEAERQRKADLEKAKKAGDRPVKAKTAPGTDSRSPRGSWREELEQLWDQASA
jgi:hypothetical protein